MPLPKPLKKTVRKAEQLSLFPTLGSVQEVIELAESKLPITDRNELYSLLMSFQNTLLAHQHASNT
jgi:hypothetical protein